MSQILNIVLEQLSFSWRDLKASGTEGGQDFAENSQMAPGVMGVDSGVVQVTEDLRGRQNGARPGPPTESK